MHILVAEYVTQMRYDIKEGNIGKGRGRGSNTDRIISQQLISRVCLDSSLCALKLNIKFSRCNRPAH